ncbi:MAG: glycosyltransferase family 2 protein [Candidatus Vecturithrix sp.]|nr:glycosyltransferase family 2 protein [Candidatus Vecturithrix sp.]
MGSMTVIVPVYNEEGAIAQTLDELLPNIENNGWQLIVVNDGSNDGTGQILEHYGNRLRVINHPYNRGYGAALKTGIRAANTELMAICDSDGQHRPEDLMLLYKEASGADIVIGERAPGSRNDLFRVPGKWLLRHAANFIVGRKIADLNSGLRIFRRAFIKKILHLMPEGFSFTSTSTVAAIKMGFLIKFVPIQTRKRIGTSSVRQVRHGFMVLMLILRLAVLFSPLRIFMPISAALTGLGVVYALYVIATVRLTLANGALFCLLAALMIFFFGLVVDQISVMRRERYMYED